MRIPKSVMAATLVTGAALFAASASAMPLPGGAVLTSHAVESAAAVPVIEVRNHRRHGGGVAAGVAAGAAAGLLLGGIIAAQPYYSYYSPYPAYPAYPPYPAYPSYYGPYPAYSLDAAIAYCMRRFRSYDPYTMTYLGYDGYRHPCP